MSETDQSEDYAAPVLPGAGASDYERYLRTDELLSLQKTPDESVHRDELLFQTVHQTSELWLKLACAEVEEAAGCCSPATRAAPRGCCAAPSLALGYVTTSLEMLEQMSPWEYQEIRVVLGHGSGFDSPGFRAVRTRSRRRAVAPSSACSRQAGLELVELYQRGREFEELYQAAEALTRLGRADLGSGASATTRSSCAASARTRRARRARPCGARAS